MGQREPRCSGWEEGGLESLMTNWQEVREAVLLAPVACGLGVWSSG